MENLSDYIGVFTQAPLAVIVLVFIYLVLKLLTGLMKDLTSTLEILTKIIKNQDKK